MEFKGDYGYGDLMVEHLPGAHFGAQKRHGFSDFQLPGSMFSGSQDGAREL